MIAESAYDGPVDMVARAKGFAAWDSGALCPYAVGSRARVDWRCGWWLANEGKELHDSGGCPDTRQAKRTNSRSGRKQPQAHIIVVSVGKQPLAPRQQQMLDYIIERLGARGEAPTIREIMVHMGTTSGHGVRDMLNTIEKRGHIKRDGAARGIVLL